MDVVLLIVLIVVAIILIAVNIKIVLVYLDKDDTSGIVGKIFIVYSNFYYIGNMLIFD